MMSEYTDGPAEGEFLLVNNNNTRTKFALSNGEEFLAHRVMDSHEVAAGSVAAALEGWTFGKVALASVVPAQVPAIETATGATEERCPYFRLDHRARLSVAVDFPSPESVGADRLANAEAVAERTEGGPVIVVDFGTAVTFDIVDERPAYIGGVIAPGLDSMRDYLHRRTALLPLIDLERPATAIGKSTEEAMLSGAFHGYRGLVVEIIRQIEKELGRRAKVVATGGYAALIAQDSPEIGEIAPLLTMEGLLRAAKLNLPA